MEHKYPSYDEVCKLIEKDMNLWAEYGEYNHECMEKYGITTKIKVL